MGRETRLFRSDRGETGNLAPMQCPFCAAPDTRVIDSRPAESGAAVRRRRGCEACDNRFTTYERSESVLMVRKRDGAMQRFDASKLRRGLETALAERPNADEIVGSVVDDVMVAARRQAPVVDSDEIGRAVLEALRRTDEVAYLRFVSVYKDFKGARDFEAEMASFEATKRT